MATSAGHMCDMTFIDSISMGIFNSCAVCTSSELALTEMNNRGDIDGHYISAGSVFPAAVSELRERFHRCF